MATKSDLVAHRDELRDEMASQTRSYMATTVGAVLTTGALAFAASGPG